MTQRYRELGGPAVMRSANSLERPGNELSGGVGEAAGVGLIEAVTGDYGRAGCPDACSSLAMRMVPSPPERPLWRLVKGVAILSEQAQVQACSFITVRLWFTSLRLAFSSDMVEQVKTPTSTQNSGLRDSLSKNGFFLFILPPPGEREERVHIAT